MDRINAAETAYNHTKSNNSKTTTAYHFTFDNRNRVWHEKVAVSVVRATGYQNNN